ncbi:hypothetical protein N656DRAFT_790404 [Canariomyces notabilis]|uniref:Heterokaryon incompatibility domain-containing protein n=1 Tax=Canariomyces notabilis TaxID=2074819 RepID=A0AAN6TBI4_9PEZI|nr:hypothetical protein N656DRAFT_790404 [Canariomyces arenarius]
MAQHVRRDKHPSVPHECQHCQAFQLSRPICPVDLINLLEVRLPHSAAQGAVAVRDGCPLFQLFPTIPLYQTFDRAAFEPWLKPYRLCYDIDGFILLRCMGWMNDPAAVDLQFRPINPRVECEEVFNFIRNEIKECYELHVRSGTCPAARNDYAPRRLICVEDDGGRPCIKLCDPTPGECIRWYQPYKTTRATLHNQYRGIDLALVYALEIPYIWIDSLCIVQDDVVTKAEDIAQMANVYSHAYITISASSSAAASEGFLQDRHIPRSMQPFALRYTSSTGMEGRILVTGEPAWTFQERVLSERLIEFSSTQVRWRCRSKQSCEAGFPPKRRYEKFFHDSLILADLASSAVDGHDSVISLGDWAGLVNSFTRRELSDPGDKLLAFSAVPRLWESDLPFNLCWRVQNIWTPLGGSQDTRQPRPTTYRAPSWSWASVDGTIDFEILRESYRSHVKAGSNENAPFGAVRAGYLVMRGSMKRATLYYSRGKLRFNGVNNQKPKDEARPFRWTQGGHLDVKLPGEDEAGDTAPLRVYAFAVLYDRHSVEGLLLDEAKDHVGAFRRVGWFWSHLTSRVNFLESDQTVISVV